MPNDNFETMLAIAHERLVMLDELKACNITIVRMQGVAIGCAGTILTGFLFWGIWRLI